MKKVVFALVLGAASIVTTHQAHAQCNPEITWTCPPEPIPGTDPESQIELLNPTFAGSLPETHQYYDLAWTCPALAQANRVANEIVRRSKLGRLLSRKKTEFLVEAALYQGSDSAIGGQVFNMLATPVHRAALFHFVYDETAARGTPRITILNGCQADIIRNLRVSVKPRIVLRVLHTEVLSNDPTSTQIFKGIAGVAGFLFMGPAAAVTAMAAVDDNVRAHQADVFAFLNKFQVSSVLSAPFDLPEDKSTARFSLAQGMNFAIEKRGRASLLYRVAPPGPGTEAATYFKNTTGVGVEKFLPPAAELIGLQPAESVQKACVVGGAKIGELGLTDLDAVMLRHSYIRIVNRERKPGLVCFDEIDLLHIARIRWPEPYVGAYFRPPPPQPAPAVAALGAPAR